MTHDPELGAQRARGLRTSARFAVWIVASLLLLLFAVYLADVALNKGKTPRGTYVGGVAVGGMVPGEAVDKLSRELGGVENKPVTVAAGDKTAEFVPSKAGLGVDWDATIERVGTESYNPFVRVAGLFRKREADIISTVDPGHMEPAMERVTQDLFVSPIDGTISVNKGKADVKDPVLGQKVELSQLTDVVPTEWLNPEGITLEPADVEPKINDAAIKAALDGPVKAALAGPLKLNGRDDVNAVIPVERLGEVVSFPGVDGAIVPKVDYKRTGAIFGEQLAPTVHEMVNARINAAGDITPHKDGIKIEWGDSLAGLEGRVFGEEPREWDAVYKPVPATFTDADARKATFDDVVGEFTTGGFETASGRNIELVAAQVNGAYVSPGETFSLNGYTGPRGAAQGYVESGIIIDGHAGRAVGGGISQFATTLYNASYFAGMTDIEHTPHSYYISRYPAGREATVYEGAIDLKIRNDSPHPVRIETSFGGGEITVRLKGTRTYKVESVNGGRWAETAPSPQVVSGPGCVPGGGAPGFTTSDTRIISDLGGRELKREQVTTVYDPQPIVRCG
ncbi:VanW family protein [Corynebacterium aquatimens]|uniref:Vancomycin resistance protein YoaR n=1 Tax=Corynebacterium aquatimens TaxID=1190508 RepID=A0A931DYR4_9CORY|nr:VanW family protein [Corynebacterium aquatimens]MBG6122867.1 vancomycin resistance protein YoaR [Corynebacterium aquatimens]